MFKLLFACSLTIHYGSHLVYNQGLISLADTIGLIPLYSTVMISLGLSRDGFTPTDIALISISALSGFAFWATLVWWNSRNASTVPSGNTKEN